MKGVVLRERRIGEDRRYTIELPFFLRMPLDKGILAFVLCLFSAWLGGHEVFVFWHLGTSSRS